VERGEGRLSLAGASKDLKRRVKKDVGRLFPLIGELVSSFLPQFC
jgi:hypothetical protein